LFVDRVELRQPQGGDERTDQPRAGQIDAFAERTAQYREADTLAVFGELSRKSWRCASPMPRDCDHN
jgi:hypothetical protein